MAEQKTQPGIVDSIWRLFASVKFTVLLLAAWTLGSVAGTIILQNGDPAQYVELYGPQWSNILMKLGFFDVYHSTWYSLILLLLMLNILGCSLNTLSGKLALAFEQPKSRRVNGSGKRFVKLETTVNNPEEAVEKLQNAMQKRFKQVQRFEEDGTLRLYAHKQPWAHFMVYVVHVSLIVIIIGGVVGALFGFEGVMEIEQQQSIDYMFKKSGTRYTRVPVSFSVQLDDFRLERFQNGSPKDYVSTLTVKEAGQTVAHKTIEVNDPLNYGVYNFYQTTYVERAPLLVTDPATGKSDRVNLQSGRQAALPNTDSMIMLTSFSPPVGEQPMRAAILAAKSEGETFQSMVLADKEQNRNVQRDQPLLVSFAEEQPAYISGLMVVVDPGVPLVWLGSFLMVLGLYLTFYSAHRRISVQCDQGQIRLTGLTQRNPRGFQREVEKIWQQAGLSENGSDEGATS